MHPLTVAREAMRTHHALQKEAELAGLLALLADVQPQVIVEVGCDAGGTLWAWQQLGPRRLLGVDLPRGGFHSGRPLERHGAEMILGNSHDPDTLRQLEVALDGDRIDFLFIDADHTYAGAKQDYEAYSRLVAPAGMVGLHDICNHPTLPQVQVGRLWVQIRDQDGVDVEEFIADPPTWGGIGVLRYQPAEVPA